MRNKIFFKFFVCVELLTFFFVSTNVAEAGIATSVVDGIRMFIEGDLNTSVEQGLKPLMEGINNSDNKNVAPEVEITFDNLTPKPGETITARAQVRGITNLDNAYYTWYLKHENDEDDVEVWKKNAVQETVRRYFDPLVMDQVRNGGNGNGVVEGIEWENWAAKGPDENKDAYVATTGGHNNKGAGEDQHFYIYDKETGEFFELGKPKNGKKSEYAEDDDLYDECGDDYYPGCMIENNERDCAISDPPVEGGGAASAEGGSGGESESDGSASTGDGGSGGEATAEFEITEEPTLSGKIRFSRCVYNGSPVCTPDGIDCPNGGKAYCVPKDNTSLGEFFLKLNDTCPDPDVAWQGWFEERSVAGAACVDFEEGFLEELDCEMKPVKEEDFKFFNSPSFHLFPAESFTEENDPLPFGMPDEEFDLDSEIYWGTNPREISTAQSLAFSDEALVVGLGITEFTWTYQPGDQIGVVVEGTSPTPTKHGDGTYQSVFAFMSNGCKPRRKGSYVTTVNGKDLLIKSARMNTVMLNNCLKDNLVSPGANEYEGLRLSMNYSNDASQAVTNDGRSLLEFETQAMLNESGGSVDSSQLYFQWSIKCGEDRTTVCQEGEDVTEEMRKSGSVVKTEGSNVPYLGVLANFPDDKCFSNGGQGFACVTAKVNAPFDAEGSTFGRTEMIIPIQRTGGQMKAFSTTSDGKTVSKKEEICGGNDMNFAFCRVVQGEVIGVEMPLPDNGTGDLVSWTVNGSPYYCSSDISTECGEASGTNKLFFPVAGALGDTIDVVANYSDPAGGEFSGKRVQRTFVIVKPDVYPEPVSGAEFQTTGTRIAYSEGEKKEYTEKSRRTIEVSPGNSVALKAVFDPPFAENLVCKNGDYRKLEWSYAREKTFDNELQVVPDTPSSVSLQADFCVPDENRMIFEKFGVSQYNFPTFYHSENSVRLVKGNGGEVASENKTTRFFATTASNTPAYFLLLLKMVLISSSMLFISRLILSITSFNNRTRWF